MATAWSIASFESLELLLSSQKRNLMGFASHSPLAPVVNTSEHRSFPVLADPTIRTYMNDEVLIPRSDFIPKIKKARATHLFLASIPDRTLLAKLKSRNITPICQPRSLAIEWEHKIKFHNFCEAHHLPVPPGRVIRSKKDLTGIKFPSVLQEPVSFSGLGTFLLSSPQSLTAVKRRSFQYPLLLREFVEGIPCGITLLIDRKGNTQISSVRAQISLPIKNRLLYHGIQWLPSSSLPKTTIEKNMKGLAAALHQEGFYGIANVDFILNGNEIFLLEINPRLSGATWQLAQHPELLGGEDFITLYTNAVLGRSIHHRIKLPTTTFSGSTFDFDALLPMVRPNQRRQSSATAGVYRLKNKKLTLSSHAITRLKRGSFFVYPGTLPQTKHDVEGWMGVLLSETSLYQVRAQSLAVTPLGKSIITACKEFIS